MLKDCKKLPDKKNIMNKKVIYNLKNPHALDILKNRLFS